MKINQSYILGKNKDPLKCEDIIFHNQHFASIIDGATSQSDHTFDGFSTGKKAALLVEAALKSLPYNATKEETAEHISSYIYDFYLEKKYLPEIQQNPSNKLTASAIIYSKFHSQIWFFGDCHCIIDNDYHESNKLIDFISSSSRAIIVEALIKKGHKVSDLLHNDLSIQYIEPILKNQQVYQNIPLKDSIYGYVCFDGFSIPTQDVKTVNVPKNTKHIVLASDGYPFLFKTLELSEKNLADLKINDPLCYKIYPSTKGFNSDLNSFDDRSFLSFYL